MDGTIVRCDARGGVHQDDVASQRHRAAAGQRNVDGHAALRGDADVRVGSGDVHSVRSLDPHARVPSQRIVPDGGGGVRVPRRRGPDAQVRDARRHKSHRERHLGPPTRRGEADGDAGERELPRVGPVRGHVPRGKLRRVARRGPAVAKAERDAGRGGRRGGARHPPPRRRRRRPRRAPPSARRRRRSSRAAGRRFSGEETPGASASSDFETDDDFDDARSVGSTSSFHSVRSAASSFGSGVGSWFGRRSSSGGGTDGGAIGRRVKITKTDSTSGLRRRRRGPDRCPRPRPRVSPGTAPG